MSEEVEEVQASRSGGGVMELAEVVSAESLQIHKYLKGIYNQEVRMADALEQIADVLVEFAERGEEQEWEE